MAEGHEHLSHLLVENRAADEEFRRRGGPDPKIQPVEDRAGHGGGRLSELQAAFSSIDQAREDQFTEAELRALGTIITLEGQDPAYPLKLDTLQQFTTHRAPNRRRPKWLLLSVLPADKAAGTPERATVWVSDDYRPRFLQLFEDYLAKESPKGKPRNNELVANIARIRATVLADLWQSDGSPSKGTTSWWEVWLRPSADGPDLMRRFAEVSGLTVSQRLLRLVDRDVMWVEATWAQLEVLPFTAIPLAEIRRPEFIDSIEDLTSEEQAEYADDLAKRLEPADELQPAVCHLDTGVARNHVLIEGSLAPQDLHTVLGVSGYDRDGHGTKMAGLALLGDTMDRHLLGSDTVTLRHRLESVRILPTGTEKQHDPRVYGDVTVQAVSLPEIAAARRRVFCMPVSTTTDTPGKPGQPTLWSATVDALAAGASVVSDRDELRLLAPPDNDAARLLMVSAGNVTGTYVADHLAESDTAAVRDPGQAWNALTVGAYTGLDTVPTDPAYAGWSALARSGDLSPHSRTSLPFGNRPWPIKPDIVMEGGNVLHDGSSMFEPNHPVLSLRTTGYATDQALASANATSAATAQAARLAALVMATYPEYWPETVRALLVHAAEWTPTMRQEIDQARRSGLQAQQMLLRRYGWGVPTEERVLFSSGRAVTLVVQDEFVPFEGDDFKAPSFRLHDLPWPREVLQDLGSTSVTLRVTLSYFIEPTASRRGWRQRYKYASHGLRFELQDPLESEAQFVQRVNHEARTEESGGRPAAGQVSWLVGANQRLYGSLHQDLWETSGAELADTGKVAVYPVGGWWKNTKNRDRIDRAVRYALVISLKTDATGVDLYTPVANTLHVPVEIPIE
ncbi:Subtilase family protein [Arthrobacter subterraneus]|uniref:Subtilase family protein n=1 Tax=Arthrobacter subterraneus TaxID=335973 RepID=A0A1G8M1Y6_9MICC|nr:S8 family peptidase [Arthrobacter subterraneus]SDI61968.1 Subtilase family protein [Arthrobacter subterraneus]